MTKTEIILKAKLIKYTKEVIKKNRNIVNKKDFFYDIEVTRELELNLLNLARAELSLKKVKVTDYDKLYYDLNDTIIGDMSEVYSKIVKDIDFLIKEVEKDLITF